MFSNSPQNLTPEEFELTVKKWFEAAAGDLESFEAQHREALSGEDGEYEIDVTIRFTAFEGARFLVLVECKKHVNPIKRTVVQILNDQIRSTGAHKGFLFATTSFQKGAREYAHKHGIALVEVCAGSVAYIRGNVGREPSGNPFEAPSFVGLHMSKLEGFGEIPMLISEKHTHHLRELLRNGHDA